MHDGGSIQYCDIDVSQMLGYNVNEESPGKNGGDHNPSIRFVAEIGEKSELIQFDAEKIDRNFKNALQDNNLQFSLIFRDHLNGNQYVIKTLEAPSFIGGEVWDICFFCTPFVIETHLLVPKAPKAITFFSYYQKLNVFFRNRRQQKFNQTLGKHFI